MQLPTIHLNGTAQIDLYDQLSEACAALRIARGKMYDAAPNGRDYYPQGAQAIHLALAEHSDRLARLNAVLTELEAILEHVADAA